MFTDWNSRLETGHPEIDAQHRQLLSHFKDFSDACRSGKGKQQLIKTYSFLENYVVEHFRDEEALMTRCNFPHIATHRLEHQDFVAKVRHLKDEINNERITLPLLIETGENLLRWVISHIHKTDVKMADFLKVHAGNPS